MGPKLVKRFVSAVGVILGILTGIFVFDACDTGTESDTLNNSVTLVCLGNSLTAGYGAVTPGVDNKAKSYPAYLQNKVTISVVNAGITGNTTAQGLARIQRDVLSQNPQIVIIELGANDLFNAVSVTTTKNNLQNIINALNNGNRKLYIAKFYTDTVARSLLAGIGITNSIMQTTLISQYDTMFTALGSSNNVTVINDIWAGVWGTYMSDGIHPNAQGYEIMANNIFNAMRPYLQANGFVR